MNWFLFCINVIDYRMFSKYFIRGIINYLHIIWNIWKLKILNQLIVNPFVNSILIMFQRTTKKNKFGWYWCCCYWCPLLNLSLYTCLLWVENISHIYIYIHAYSISITEMQTTNGINSQLSITHSDRQDSGVYKCVAENPFGKSEYIIYVAVQGM